jgi:hypothetical protein
MQMHNALKSVLSAIIHKAITVAQAKQARNMRNLYHEVTEQLTVPGLKPVD